MTRFLFDMGLPRRACDDLQAEGMDVAHLGTRGLARMSDADAIALAVREGRVVVTLDRDFCQLVALSGARMPSIVHIRQNVDRAKTVALIRLVVASCEEALASGCLVSVTTDQMRIRPLPVERSD